MRNVVFQRNFFELENVKLDPRHKPKQVRRSSIDLWPEANETANQGGQFATLAGNKLIFVGGAARLICVQSSRSRVWGWGRPSQVGGSPRTHVIVARNGVSNATSSRSVAQRRKQCVERNGFDRNTRFEMALNPPNKFSFLQLLLRVSRIKIVIETWLAKRKRNTVYYFYKFQMSSKLCWIWYSFSQMEV